MGPIGRKCLGVSGGFKPLHPSFPLAGRLVRIFRPIIEVGPNPILTLEANSSAVLGEEG